jgi:hypothetical protein
MNPMSSRNQRTEDRNQRPEAACGSAAFRIPIPSDAPHAKRRRLDPATACRRGFQTRPSCRGTGAGGFETRLYNRLASKSSDLPSPAEAGFAKAGAPHVQRSGRWTRRGDGRSRPRRRTTKQTLCIAGGRVMGVPSPSAPRRRYWLSYPRCQKSTRPFAGRIGTMWELQGEPSRAGCRIRRGSAIVAAGTEQEERRG